jgi:hypothetical protein
MLPREGPYQDDGDASLGQAITNGSFPPCCDDRHLKRRAPRLKADWQVSGRKAAGRQAHQLRTVWLSTTLPGSVRARSKSGGDVMLGMIVITALLGQAAPVAPRASPQCAVRYAARYVRHLADLPKQVRDDILKDGQIADPDQPFEAYDDITDPTLPRARLMLAGESGTKWFVWIDRGGFVRRDQVYGYGQLWDKVDHFDWYRSAQLQGDPCIGINAFLDGVTTPTH